MFTSNPHDANPNNVYAMTTERQTGKYGERVTRYLIWGGTCANSYLGHCVTPSGAAQIIARYKEQDAAKVGA